ncbi:unnamed protein product [Paramecium octaurelia]|uniref:Uncharacterized protein n=1 Tax=Paramecium octaurelia TaxID=43137 RepID=A0A8S1XF93_PAROT|nr:unnamed protein product [Paramecium octaurelia]
MFNNIKRNLTIFNKDIVETSWLKSLIDDVPKVKHIQILHKCLSGEYTNVDPKVALRKISQRLQHSQKPLNALKSLYLAHLLNKFLITQLTDKIIDQQSKDPAEVLMASVAHLYYSYLKQQKNAFEKIDSIYKMNRQLEVLMIKTNIPILKEIITLLIIDIITIYESIDIKEDYEKRIRAMKQVRRFVDLKGYLQMNQELQNKLKTLNFSDIKQQKCIESKICKTIPISQEIETHQLEISRKQLSIQVNDSTQFETYNSCQGCPQERKMSLQTGTIINQKGIVQSNTTRASSIRDNFFVPKQGPLSFLIPS